jgi:hypothetical protein
MPHNISGKKKESLATIITTPILIQLRGFKDNSMRRSGTGFVAFMIL